MSNNKQEFPWYIKDVSHLNFIDIYRVLDLYQVDDPALQHAAKKILCSGQRGHKNTIKDVEEAIYSLNRFLEMQRENTSKDKNTQQQMQIPLENLEEKNTYFSKT